MTDADKGRTLWAALELLDRQILDCDETPAGKVDDLEFEAATRPGELPVLTNILSGQAALAYRLNRRIARGLEYLRRVIEPASEPGPGRISWSLVKDVTTNVALSVRARDVPNAAVERWLAEHIIGRLPGGQHRAESDG